MQSTNPEVYDTCQLPLCRPIKTSKKERLLEGAPCCERAINTGCYIITHIQLDNYRFGTCPSKLSRDIGYSHLVGWPQYSYNYVLYLMQLVQYCRERSIKNLNKDSILLHFVSIHKMSNITMLNSCHSYLQSWATKA